MLLWLIEIVASKIKRIHNFFKPMAKKLLLARKKLSNIASVDSDSGTT